MAYYKIERDTELDILEEPYTYRQAFLDLRQLACFKEGTYRKQNGKIINVPVGSLARSEDRLGKKRMRSRGKVSRFLSYLEGLGKIEQQNIGGNDWIIYIKGYDCTTTNDTTKRTTNSTTNDTYKKEGQLMQNNIYCAFTDFWNLYNKKIDREKCEGKWNRLKETDRQKIMETLPSYLATIKDKQFQKNPATYLNNKSRENEIVVSNTPKTDEEWIAEHNKLHPKRFEEKYGREKGIQVRDLIALASLRQF